MVYRWSQTECILFYLAYFTQHVILKFIQVVCVSTIHSFLLLILGVCQWWRIIDIPQFIYPLASWWTFGLNLVLSYYKYSCSEHSHASLYMGLCFDFSRITPTSEIAGFCSRNMFNLLRNGQTVLHVVVLFTSLPEMSESSSSSNYLLGKMDLL